MNAVKLLFLKFSMQLILNARSFALRSVQRSMQGCFTSYYRCWCRNIVGNDYAFEILPVCACSKPLDEFLPTFQKLSSVNRRPRPKMPCASSILAVLKDQQSNTMIVATLQAPFARSITDCSLLDNGSLEGSTIRSTTVGTLQALSAYFEMVISKGSPLSRPTRIMHIIDRGRLPLKALITNCKWTTKTVANW